LNLQWTSLFRLRLGLPQRGRQSSYATGLLPVFTTGYLYAYGLPLHLRPAFFIFIIVVVIVIVHPLLKWNIYLSVYM
jgi:hypothetical protein